MTDYREQLRAIRTFPMLVRFLRDELQWPIDSSADFEDLSFQYTPEELGIDPASAAKVEEIKQLRRLSPNQPWGVFFIKFEPKRLPVVALRRILGRLASAKRATAGAGERPRWSAEDLLFISNYGDGEERKLSFAHFSEETKTSLPTLKVLAWDDLDTPLHLEYAANTLVEKLTWPTSEHESDKTAWRNRWRSAFELEHREVVKTSKALAVRLAALAARIRTRIRSVLEIETHAGPMHALMNAFRESLVHDLDEDGFADMYAQTIAYGLLSARIADPTNQGVTDVAAHIHTSPFLRDLMEGFLSIASANAGRPQGVDFDELGVGDVVALLDRANMAAVVRDFGDRNPLEDPVIHFYELFLKEYDAKKRLQRGVFYTPRPVVSYIVRAVHELLQDEFGLRDGLADTSTWGEVAARIPGIDLPTGVESTDRFVTLLDPATGTGTFLVEAIEVIHGTLAAKWHREGRSNEDVLDLWNAYVAEHLLPRLYGYELLMAPYAIAHLKIGLKLHETGYRFESPERVRIYLTNALEPGRDFSGEFDFALPSLAREAAAVNSVKLRRKFTVVIGNPPYSGVSSNRNSWIDGLLKGHQSIEGTKANYYEVDGQPIQEKKLWLQDDYVKFIRLSQHLLDQAGAGIHAMITNHSYLDSPTCRGMRFQMQHFFSLLNFIDLHGSIKKGERHPDGLSDENLFDILPGVAIGVCVAGRGHQPQPEVRTFDLWGTRSLKSDWLLGHGVRNVDWELLSPAPPYFLFVRRHLEFEKEYQGYRSLREVFPFYGTGIQTSRDDFATDMNKQDLEKRLRKFFDLRLSDGQVTEEFGLTDTRGWKVKDVRRSSGFDQVRKSIVQYLYRTFDSRWIALTKDIADWPRLEVMSGVGPGRIGLLCSRQQSVPGFRHALVVDEPVDMFCLSNNSREGQTLFPLFVRDSVALLQSSATVSWRPNLGTKFADDVAGLLLAEVSTAKEVAPSDQTAMQAFNYVYGILYSLEYRRRYADLLKMDYPRVPLPLDPDLYREVARLGAEVASQHLGQSLAQLALSAHYEAVAGSWQYDTGGRSVPLPLSFNGSQKTLIGTAGWSDDTVWIDLVKPKRTSVGPHATGTIGFQGVPEEVWDFKIGGYQVCAKWLKDRKGRTLTADDITLFHRIVIAIHETIRIMVEIDQLIDKYGGWPVAFIGR